MDERSYLELAREASMQQLDEDGEGASSRVKLVLEQIREHLFEPELEVGEAELLSRLGTEARETAAIAHDFLLEMGETPSQYLRTVRMVGSIQLIGKTSLPFERIAELLGWDTVTSLGKACRTLYGSSPGALRRQARREYPELCLAPVANDSEGVSDEERERFARRLARALGEWLTADKLELLATGELQVDPLVFELMKEEAN